MTATTIGTVYQNADTAVRDARNVFCVGRNYRDHATELGNAVPTEPMIFGKFTHSLCALPGDAPLPSGRSNIHHELEIVLWVAADYQRGIALSQLIGGIALGLDLTDREAQNRLKAAGQPWEYAKSFKNAALITDFYHVDDWEGLADQPFSLHINGQLRQLGYTKDMIFPPQVLVDFIGEHFGLKAGDMIYTGTPAGVGPLAMDDHLELRFAEQVWGTAVVR